MAYSPATRTGRRTRGHRRSTSLGVGASAPTLDCLTDRALAPEETLSSLLNPLRRQVLEQLRFRSNVIRRAARGPNKCHSETCSQFERAEESAFSWEFGESRSLAALGMTNLKKRADRECSFSITCWKREDSAPSCRNSHRITICPRRLLRRS